jgi:iron complex outermembrane receptor protein
VVRGPGSSLYGENAFWGVINIVTLSGEDLQGGHLEGFGGGERGTGSGGASYGHRMGEASVFVSAKYLRSQLPMEFWMDDGGHSKGTDVFSKVTWKGLQASYYRHEDKMGGFDEELPIPGLPPGTAFKSAPEVGQTVDIAALRYDQDPKGRDFTVSASASYAHRFGTHCAACHAATEHPHFEGQADHGYQALGDFRVNYRGIKGNELLVGVEGRHVDAGHHPEELAEPVQQGLYSYSKFAAYVQDQLSFAEDKVILTGGLRYDGKTDLFEHKVSPRVALVVNPIDPLVLRGGYSTAFRFPNFSELSQDTWFINANVGPFAFPLAVFRPNQQLQPEEIRTYDLGAEYRFSSRLSAKVDLYRSTLKNFMVISFQGASPPAAPSLGVENQPDDAVVRGLETELRWNVSSKTTGFVNYAYQSNHQQGQLRDSSGHLFEFAYAPTHKVNFGGYLGPFSGVRASAEMAWKGDYTAPGLWGFVTAGAEDPSLLFSTPSLEGYALLDSRISYDLPFDVGTKKRPLRLTVYGKNLLDKHPRETLIGVNTSLVGREFFGEISLDF